MKKSLKVRPFDKALHLTNQLSSIVNTLAAQYLALCERYPNDEAVEILGTIHNDGPSGIVFDAIMYLSEDELGNFSDFLRQIEKFLDNLAILPQGEK